MAINPNLLQYLLLTIVIGLIVLTFLVLRLILRFNRFAKGGKINIIKLLEDLRTSRDINARNIKALSEGIVQLKELQKMNVQKQALIRFNPFEDTGGDQSFVYALLDGENTGVVISSLHSRESTRLYAKSVVKGKAGGHQFSKEEKEVVEKAARQS